MITNTYTYYSGGQLATEATPQWASSTVTLGYTSRLRTSLTLAQPVIGNWTHSYTWDSARRLDTLTGSSGSFAGVPRPFVCRRRWESPFAGAVCLTSR